MVEAASSNTRQYDRTAALEERIRELEDAVSSSFQSFRGALQQISSHVGLQDVTGTLVGFATRSAEDHIRPDIQAESTPELFEPGYERKDLIDKGVLTLEDCRMLFDFYGANCSEIIAFFDNTMASFEETRRYPLLLAAMCTIGARASAPRLYRPCLNETYSLIQQTLLGPVPSLETLKGILLMAVWHKNYRLLGLVLSIAYQIQLPETALSLADNTSDHDEDSIDRARTWLSFCCVDLVHNTSKTYFVSESDRYTRLGSHLTSMPYRRNVDYRIRAYLEIYGILNQAKKDAVISDNMQRQPITSGVCRQLQLYDKQLQGWFRRNDEEMDPIYQTFSKPQDRNRMAIPYNFARMHLNGLVLHGLKPDSASNDPLRVQFIRAAVDAGKALLKCALRSIDYQANLNYSIDYSGSALGLAINFLSRATCVAYDCIDLEGVMRILAQARDMFEGAKLAGKADEVSHILDQVAEIKRTMTATKPRNDTTEADINDNVDDGSDFFLNARLPLSEFSLDEPSIEDILMYSGE
ncbi:hypothetical protein ANOM_011710 [Aspergillus nomiae NRRL 13137]|uniref:Transcription factor domain-containing protein n=1 Tax=Aspergillus nomiae NRRL (strain ATCC 15546 / NRRL 13137 / CBS 260.88 / M93) TaxID=1509407 RepID=A0A0L1IL15_ASPN3|nr:uncharacterized protein ANOM_011710 [Aspergillus nomiae NRRL 13137]KNG79935.1 hypothetical protein ANOM_011710 [Aspergillus nomiae NRRL 13137]